MDYRESSEQKNAGTQLRTTPNDFDESAHILRLLEFFSHQPNFSEFCQYVVLDMFSEMQPWGACVASCKQDGHMQIIGSFGLGDGLVSQYEGSSCVGMPRTGGLYVNGQPTMDSDKEQPLDNSGLFKVLNSHGPNSLGLISTDTSLAGFFQLLFLQPFDTLQLIPKMDVTLRVLRALLPAHRPTAFQIPAFEFDLQQSTSISHASLEPKVSKASHELTPRQMQILQHMADGKTNASIARLIGFSESTVRQETIDIYRKLGVCDRRSAAEVAERTGLLIKQGALPN